MSSKFPLLNWRELARLVEQIGPECAGAHVERLVIPERPDFPEGYLKNEWVLRLQDRKKDWSLGLSVRPRACYMALTPGKGPKHASTSTRSPFDQVLSKQLRGLRLLSLRAVDRERLVVLEFPGFLLVLVLIPALPEAILVESKTLRIVARSRTIREAARQQEVWAWPVPREVPAGLEVREPFFSSPFAYAAQVETALRAEAFQIRTERARRAIGESMKSLEQRVRQADEAVRHAESEPDYAIFGEALKATLHDLPEPRSGEWHLEGGVRVPVDERLTAVQQVERFFALARRRNRRMHEARVRGESSRLRMQELSAARAAFDLGVDAASAITRDSWQALAALERAAGLVAESDAAGGAATSTSGAAGFPGHRVALKAPVPAAWTGKTYVSKDGFPIFVGRSRDENLELTFRIARGNDLWMHVRGKPGAHVVIPVPSGKSVPLETLLDAAALCIYWSGGKGWGKTEVDYTHKKHVRRIKDSTEASYTHNKTLIAQPDTARLAIFLES